MAALLLSVLAACAAAALVWLVVRRAGRAPLAHVPGPPSPSFFKGHLGLLYNSKGLPYHLGLVATYGGVVKVNGFFGDAQLYISDPQALHTIIMKEQENFEETAVFIENNKIIFGEGLVSTTGAQHKRQRKLINPVFAPAQLRALTPVFHDIAHKLCAALRAEQARAHAPLDMAAWLARAALEAIGRAGLGHSLDPLASPASNAYTRTVRELIPTLFRLSLLRQLAPFATRLGPPALRRALLFLVPNRALRRVAHMSDVIFATSRAILAAKRAGGGAHDVSGVTGGRDIMSVLLRANERAGAAERLSEAELLGQMSVLIFGAQDTTASAMTRIAHLLAVHPALQARVRGEVRAARAAHGGADLDYEQVCALPWLDAVFKETLRLYPPVPFVRRTTLKDTVVPLSRPLSAADAQAVPSILIPAGTTLYVGIAAVNRSEDVWGADAAQWRPERWMGELPSSTKAARLPSVYPGMLTFLGGGRSCVGYKFALIEMKIIMSALLATFTFAPTGDRIVWNLSQIISPSVAEETADGAVVERQGLPLSVELVSGSEFED